MRVRVSLCLLLLGFLLYPGSAFAQSTPTLSQLVVGSLVDGVRMRSNTVNVAGNPHEAHFIAALGQSRAAFEINKAIVGQLGTFPIGGGSSGFSLSFDSSTGLSKPASVSFGPAFAERALTNGRRRLGFGLNYQRVGFNAFEGANLEDGNVTFALQHNDCCTTPLPTADVPFFEGDIVLLSLKLKINSTVVAPFVSYGITNRWDVGVIVPYVQVEIDSTATATVDRVSSASYPTLHTFDGVGGDSQTTHKSGSATGLGDLVLRTKYRFADAAGGGVAAGIDLRLPTGDKENLLGTGATQVKLSLIGSKDFTAVSPHFNLGFTASRGGLSTSLTTLNVPASDLLPTSANPPTQAQLLQENGVPISEINLNLQNEFNYAAGLDVIATPLLTISGDILGRTLLDSPRFGNVSQAFTYFTPIPGAGAPLTDTTRPLTANRNTFTNIGSGNLHLLLGVIGAKVNIKNTGFLLTGSVIFPMTRGGLVPNVTPVIGIDYSFK